MTMGIPEERDNPEFVAMVQRIIDTAAKYGIAAGAHYSKMEHARRLIEHGGRFVPVGSDLRMIQFGSAELVEALAGKAVEDKDRII
jgi:2-keto-3-deoxy-L-rhamnonate aldolase RhmA